MPGLPIAPAVHVYDATPFLDAVAEIRTRTPNDPAFTRAYTAAYKAARLPRMSSTAIAHDPAAATSAAESRNYLRDLRTEFGRDSWDGKGSELNIDVHAPGPWPGTSNDNLDAYASEDLRGNDGKRVQVSIQNGVITNGKRVTAADAEGALPHEITHMIWENEVGYTKTHRPWRDALNEAWADALAFTFDDDWVMGENSKLGIPGWRDVSKPTFRTIADIPSYDTPIPGQAWEHAAADTLNQPMVAFANKYGRKEMGHVWYDALANEMNPKRVGVTDAARATLRAATTRYGTNSEQVAMLKNQWKRIGVTS
jgi:Zn-dependent metalloprotease